MNLVALFLQLKLELNIIQKYFRFWKFTSIKRPRPLLIIYCDDCWDKTVTVFVLQALIYSRLPFTPFRSASRMEKRNHGEFHTISRQCETQIWFDELIGLVKKANVPIDMTHVFLGGFLLTLGPCKIVCTHSSP